jgi:ATP-binding cassette subfamily C exporter for protease/lipase
MMPHLKKQYGPLRRSLWSLRVELMWIALFSAIANLMTLAPTLYMLQLFDRIMLSRSDVTLIVITLLTVLFVAVMAFAEWVRSRLLVRAGVQFDAKLNTQIFLASFEARLDLNPAGSVQAFSSLTRLRQFLTGNGLIALFDLPWMPIYLAVLFIMHPLLGWFGIGFAVFLILLNALTHRLSASMIERAASVESRTNAALNSNLRNAEVVESMGMMASLKQRWQERYLEQLRFQSRAQSIALKMQALSKFIQYSQQSLILALGAILVIRGDLSMGAMVASNLLMGNVLRPVSVLVGSSKEFVQARQSARELDALLNAYPDRAEGHQPGSVQGQVTLRQLSATATQRDKPILNNIDIRFEQGELIGIVGPSGAGKSTLARCLVGTWPHVTGTVEIDGVDILQWSRQMLGPHIGYVPQDIQLLEGTVAENICRFNKIDSAMIIEAATMAGVHEMILRLPLGYDTPVGMAGKLLSAGQRQRLALSRALYGMPAIVVLDEPNANLDDAGEAALIASLRALKSAGKTVFMVLHQRNLLTLADRVIVMTEGQISQVIRPAASADAQPLSRAVTPA